MDVKCGQSKVTLRPGKGIVELRLDEAEAPCGILLGGRGVVSVMSADKAKKLGAALIRVANSV